ncbi:amino acid transporter-like protein [Halenospora varia]|nr:amino acid transporter-like protein [Halenospora varia]
MKSPYDSSQESTANSSAQDLSPADLADMRRLGKKQEFKRNFNLLSTLGFISIYMATWEFVLVSLGAGLISGGFGGLFWEFLGTVVCYSSIVASLAEMESMAPTSGGQYHWVSEFAPERWQKICRWMSTLGWLASVSSSVFVLTTLVQAIVQVANAEFSFPAWQYTLIMLAFLVITIGFNTWGAKILPMLETISLFGHLGGFLVTMIAILALAPKNSAKQVFTEVVNSSGWENIGASLLIAQVSVLYCNLGKSFKILHQFTRLCADSFHLGSDSAVHISEEVEDASINVPRAMWWSFVLNVIMGIAMLFCIGDLDTAINADAPYLILFENTDSKGLTFFLLALLLVLVFAGNITALATTSRELFAFARDKGFPFSTWISKMNHERLVPDNAVYLTSITSGLLCLINFGSSLAFNIIVSLALLALLSTYMISIGCVLLLRLQNKPLPPARWSLGRWGIPINAFAFAYSGFVIIFACFPAELPVTTDTANWASMVWGGVIALAVVVYYVHGRRKYTPPVVFVEGREGLAMGKYVQGLGNGGRVLQGVT